MSEEEIELRDLVAQTLENNGVLSRIRVYKQRVLCYYVIFSECIGISKGYSVCSALKLFFEYIFYVKEFNK